MKTKDEKMYEFNKIYIDDFKIDLAMIQAALEKDTTNNHNDEIKLKNDLLATYKEIEKKTKKLFEA
jgi:hypothetical protein